MLATKSKQFELDLLGCSRELQPLLHQLIGRYSPVVVVGALAVQVATNVRTLIERGICTPESARDIFRRLENDLLG